MFSLLSCVDWYQSWPVLMALDNFRILHTWLHRLDHFQKKKHFLAASSHCTDLYRIANKSAPRDLSWQSIYYRVVRRLLYEISERRIRALNDYSSFRKGFFNYSISFKIIAHHSRIIIFGFALNMVDFFYKIIYFIQNHNQNSILDLLKTFQQN